MKPSYSGCWEPASLSHRLPKETQVGAAELQQTDFYSGPETVRSVSENKMVL